MTGEQAKSEGVALVQVAGEHAEQLPALAAIPDRLEVLRGQLTDVTPAQAVAQLGEHLAKAVGRMDDVSLNMESTADGTRFSFRAYRK